MQQAAGGRQRRQPKARLARHGKASVVMTSKAEEDPARAASQPRQSNTMLLASTTARTGKASDSKRMKASGI
jgi:hypothetical protein